MKETVDVNVINAEFATLELDEQVLYELLESDNNIGVTVVTSVS